MFVPLGTDAPIYHWPRTTVGLVVVNVGVYFLFRRHWRSVEPWMLAYGHGLQPAQWLTYTFLHPNMLILAANMLYLWMFGMIVEGKLGNLKFLATYLGLAAFQALLEQGVFLVNAKGAGLGTTSMIFALMAMAVVWAPKNDISCVWVGFTVRPVDLPVMGIAAFYVVCELIAATYTGIVGLFANVALMHLVGGVLGFALATVLLKTDVVDCEGWDLFTVLRGDHNRSGKRPKKPVVDEWGIELEEEDEDASDVLKKGELRLAALKTLNDAVNQEHAAAALTLYRKYVERKARWMIPEPDHLALLKLLLRERMGAELAPILEQYVTHAKGDSDRLRLILARTLIREQQRPGHGTRILATVAYDRLPSAMKNLHQQLAHEAAQLRAEGAVELEDEGW